MKRLVALAALALLFPHTAAAGNVDVGLYILNLGKYDVATGSFSADFYLSMRCEENCSTDFEFMNGRASSVDRIIDEPGEKFYRIAANLNSPVDLQNFPFDRQKMRIVLEDKKNVIEDLRYVPDEKESGIDGSIAFTGWNIDGWRAEAVEHHYPVYNETFSQYVYTIDISRISLNSFFKTFLPVFFMVLIVMFSFVMDPDKVTTRLTVTTSALIASVMFHISVSNQIPPVGYLTNADKFMLVTYSVILLSAVLNIILLELSEQKKTRLVERFHRATEYSIFMIVPLIYLIFFLYVLYA